MTKLLDRPLRAFTIYSLVILIISIPCYFLVVDYIWLDEFDEQNEIIKERAIEHFENRRVDAEQLSTILNVWNMVQPGTSIEPWKPGIGRTDSIYEVYKTPTYLTEEEVERFRGLQAFFEINNEPYIIRIETNIEEASETLLAIAIVTLVFFILLIIGFIILNRRISLNSWKPFYQTLGALKSFDLAEDKEIKLDKSDIFEFRELNESLKKLVERNIVVYQQQKAFTENASHELQTPIALLKSRLDILLQEKNVTSNISEIINSVGAPLSRLTRINKNLLLLAKVENSQFEQNEMLSIADYIKKALELFEDYITNQKLEIVTLLEESQRKANSFLLETLIHNLLSNAIRHTAKGGKISITLDKSHIVFSNSGSEPLDSNKLFKRFSAVSDEKIGSGLGLAIVKEIANKYGWKLQYDFKNNFHFFIVSF